MEIGQRSSRFRLITERSCGLSQQYTVREQGSIPPRVPHRTAKPLRSEEANLVRTLP
jgi:hypothetical protein